MSVSITHAKVSGKPAGTDPDRIYGTHWDADHVVPVASNAQAITGTSSDVLMTPAATAAAMGSAVPSLTSVFYAKTYGALFSGLSSTAVDRAAIQQAINAANTAGGGVVELPYGEAILDGTTLTLYDDIWLRGQGLGATKLTLSSAFNGAVLSATSKNRIKVTGITIDMGSFDAGASNFAFLFTDCDDVEIDRNEIDNMGRFGIGYNGGDRVRITRNKIRKTSLQTSEYTTLSGGINDSVTTLTIANATGHFATNGVLYIGTELISYAALDLATGVATGCTRGAYGTSAASHSNGDLVQAAPSQNQAILIASSLPGFDCLVDDNDLIGSAINVAIGSGRITNNRINGWRFGAGITTEAQEYSHDVIISGNTITGGRGVDTNRTVAGGIENWAPYSIITNNVICYNDGEGISHGGYTGLVSNNIVHDNGQYYTTGSLNGISIRYGSGGNYQGSYSTILGNIAYNQSTTLSGGINASVLSLTIGNPEFLPDSGALFIGTEKILFSAVNRSTGVVTLTKRGSGGSTAASHSNGDTVLFGYQAYGYYEESASLAGIRKGVNFFDSNRTAAEYVLSSTTYNGLMSNLNLSDVANAATARTNLGVGTGDSPQFTAVNIGHATDTTLARSSAGNLSVEGNLIYRAGGTDVPVTDGGTGASDASGARTNLGLVIGTNVQAWDADLDTWATKTAPSGTVVGTSDSQALTNKTLTTPVINGTSTGTGVATANTADTLVMRDSVGAILQAVSRVKIRQFTAGTTWTPTTGTISAIIECVGGGGGGGGVAGALGQAGGGGGGGAGGTARTALSLSQINTAISSPPTVTIGAGGAGGTAGANNGSNGGATSVGSLCAANGGGGGTGSAGMYGGGGVGGAGTTGDTLSTGGAGITAIGILDHTKQYGLSGQGANSSYGCGGIGGLTASGVTAGIAATGYGAGGGGAVAYNTTSTAAGGNGSGGIVIITEFLNQQ